MKYDFFIIFIKKMHKLVLFCSVHVLCTENYTGKHFTVNENVIWQAKPEHTIILITYTLMPIK